MTSRPYVTLCSDFGVQSQGVAAMEAQIFRLAPEAKVIHLMHGLPPFDVVAGARTLETLDTHPIGCHVCVVDPGVGTLRNPIVIKTKRGDFLIGPDNGVLVPAAQNFLGGIEAVRKIENPNFMREEVSPLFHGRDIFAPTAGKLAAGAKFEEVGSALPIEQLVTPPYVEAQREAGKLCAQVIQINRYGSLHLNVQHAAWDELSFELGSEIRAEFPDSKIQNRPLRLRFSRTFGDVEPGQDVIVKDDYGRVEVAKNMGSFAEQVGAQTGHRVEILLAH